LINLDRRVAVSVLVVADVLELALAPPGRYPLEHAGERTEMLLHSDRQREDFRQTLGAGPARLAELARSLGLRCSSISTTADAFESVASLLGAKRPPR
jgi:hypothetical protein